MVYSFHLQFTLRQKLPPKNNWNYKTWTFFKCMFLSDLKVIRQNVAEIAFLVNWLRIKINYIIQWPKLTVWLRFCPLDWFSLHELTEFTYIFCLATRVVHNSFHSKFTNKLHKRVPQEGYLLSTQGNVCLIGRYSRRFFQSTRFWVSYHSSQKVKLVN